MGLGVGLAVFTVAFEQSQHEHEVALTMAHLCAWIPSEWCGCSTRIEDRWTVCAPHSRQTSLPSNRCIAVSS